MIKLVIFDLDGTILDTLGDLTSACNKMLDTFGFPNVSKEFCSAHTGWGVEVLIEGALKNQNIPYDKAYKVFNDYYSLHQYDLTKPYLGIVEVLNILKTRGYILAVNSNKPHERVKNLCDLYFPNVFSYATGDDFIHPNKPDAFRMNLILEHFHVKTSEAIYVGDTEVDFESGKNANLETILVSWGFRSKVQLQKLHSKYLIDKAEDLLKIIN